ncbi:MAG: 4-hydroxythreonine-4-phosphate dehydrogenase PdxA [Bacteroidales bacterium]
MEFTSHETQPDNLVRVGITHGDFNGIGYEVILKTLADPRICELCTPLVYGSSKIASYHKKTINIPEYMLNVVKRADQLHPRKPNILNISMDEARIELGKSTTQAGEFAFAALEKAVQDLRENRIDVLVTGPINKKNIQSLNFKFPGHTEYLSSSFNAKKHLMLMVCSQFRIGTVTGHVPIREVAGMLSTDLILDKIRILNDSLTRDFGVRRPRIAILGLNPHAGDGGLLGKEDQDLIMPAIQRAQRENILALGPFAADGFFGSAQYTKYDAILAMYHDQGLIPFKALAFEGGVNFTAGLPIIRTSPAHGTAYDIAGKDLASEESFREALYLAIDIHRNRNEYAEITKDPLRFGLTSENVVDEDVPDLPDEPML